MNSFFVALAQFFRRIFGGESPATESRSAPPGQTTRDREDEVKNEDAKLTLKLREFESARLKVERLQSDYKAKLEGGADSTQLQFLRVDLERAMESVRFVARAVSALQANVRVLSTAIGADRLIDVSRVVVTQRQLEEIEKAYHVLMLERSEVAQAERNLAGTILGEDLQRPPLTELPPQATRVNRERDERKETSA